VKTRVGRLKTEDEKHYILDGCIIIPASHRIGQKLKFGCMNVTKVVIKSGDG